MPLHGDNVQLAQPGVVTFPSVAFHAQYTAPGSLCGPQPWLCGPTVVGWRPVWHTAWSVMCSHVGQFPSWAAAAPTSASARITGGVRLLGGRMALVWNYQKII